MARRVCATCGKPVDDARSVQRADPPDWEPRWLHLGECSRVDAAPTLPPSSRQRGPFPAKAAHDRRHESADEADLRDDGGTT